MSRNNYFQVRISYVYVLYSFVPYSLAVPRNSDVYSSTQGSSNDLDFLYNKILFYSWVHFFYTLSSCTSFSASSSHLNMGVYISLPPHCVLSKNISLLIIIRTIVLCQIHVNVKRPTVALIVVRKSRVHISTDFLSYFSSRATKR
jgi:hypothetical protein